jgi:hypothetical protein
MHRAQAEAIIAKHADLLRLERVKPADRPLAVLHAPSAAEAPCEPVAAPGAPEPVQHAPKPARRRRESMEALPPSTRRCVVETVLAMRARGTPCRADDIVLVAWARWPSIFSVAGVGTPSDHKVRVALAKVGEWVKRVEVGLYEPRPGSARFVGLLSPEREVVDAEAVRVLLRGP